jgi:peptide-methionine (S)-S-oxide reductase
MLKWLATTAETTEEAIPSLADEGIWGKPIVTRVVPFETYYEAQEYHQDYSVNNRRQPYRNVVIAPKVAKCRQQYGSMSKG